MFDKRGVVVRSEPPVLLTDRQGSTHLYAVCCLLWRSSFNTEDDLILTQSGGILKPAPECRPAGEILVRRRQTLDGRRRETDGGPWTAGLELVAAPHGCAEKARALAGGQPGAYVSHLLGLVDDSEANREVPCPFLHTQPRREHESLIDLVHSYQACGGYVFTR